MATLSLRPRSIPLDDSWDVIVVGGGPAGTAAATAAAREGAKTLVIEGTGALGGMGTLGLVPWFCGYTDHERHIACGLAEHVRQRLLDGLPHFRKAVNTWGPLSDPPIAPELLKRIYDDMVVGAGATILFHTQMCSVERAADGEIEAIVVSNKAGISAYAAKVYVDGTGDGDLAAWAGATIEKGDERGDLQPATHCFVLTNVNDYHTYYGTSVHFFDPNSPVHKAMKSGRYPLIHDLHSCSMQFGPGNWGFNTGHIPFDVDNTDPFSVSRALVHGRKQAASYRDAFAEFLPAAFGASVLTMTGSLLGVRETRRVMGDYKLTMDDYLARRSFPDEICRNAYNIDVHRKNDTNEFYGKQQGKTPEEIERLKKDIEKAVHNLGKGESFGVPYRCLTPKGLRNVLVAGRCISTDRRTNGSTRIMACCLTTGEAAGLAAALAARGDSNVHNVDTAALRAKLRAAGVYLP